MVLYRVPEPDNNTLGSACLSTFLCDLCLVLFMMFYCFIYRHFVKSDSMLVTSGLYLNKAFVWFWSRCPFALLKIMWQCDSMLSFSKFICDPGLVVVICFFSCHDSMFYCDQHLGYHQWNILFILHIDCVLTNLVLLCVWESGCTNAYLRLGRWVDFISGSPKRMFEVII